jgi:hypothetical protein
MAGFLAKMLVPSASPLAAGVKTGAGISGVAIVFNSSVGKFTVSADLTKKLSVQNGDYLMFTTNEGPLNSLIQAKDEDYLAFAEEIGGDPDAAATRSAFVKANRIYFVAKGFAKYKDNGDPHMVNAAVTPADKKAYLEAHRDELFTKNEEAILTEYRAQADAAGEELPTLADGSEDLVKIKALAKAALNESCVDVSEVETAKIQAYAGSKLATVGGSGGVGYQLNGSDKAIWTDIKSDVEPDANGVYDPMYLDELGKVNPAKFNRRFKVLEESAVLADVKNGNRTESVLWYPIVKDDEDGNCDSIPSESLSAKKK